MLADEMIKALKESTDAPKGKKKVPSYIHRMVGFRSLEAEQRRMTDSYAITVTFDGGLMTNLRANRHEGELTMIWYCRGLSQYTRKSRCLV